MLIEDFLTEQKIPLKALEIIAELLEEGIYERWNFFNKECCQDAYTLQAIIAINMQIVRRLFYLHKKYNRAFNKEWEAR